jgi:hypothetical protein
MLPKPVVPSGAITQVTSSPVAVGTKEQKEILKNKYEKFRNIRKNK